MSVFGDLANYYDLLYTDKAYSAEASYVHQLLQRFGHQGNRLLSLGCGTGAHDLEMVRLGYSTVGVDLSENMLELARKKRSQQSEEVQQRLNFHQGDLRKWRSDQQFDAVMSLFHVLSYQTSQQDLELAFATIRHHLKPGGLVVFDCWYGPAVLTDRPGEREKRWENDQLEVIRQSRPTLLLDENVVEVNFEISIQDRIKQENRILKEQHRMRYLFLPELCEFLNQAGLNLLHQEEWMSGAQLDDSTWYATLVAQAR